MDIEKILSDAMRDEILGNPPTIGVVGVSGVGKSSTINSLFNTNLAISHVKACTKEFQKVDLQLNNSSIIEGERLILRVIDAPGLGEDIDFDESYLALYQNNLENCDIVLWILSARNRAMSMDQQYLKRLIGYREKIIFGLNQVDIVDPMDWNQNVNLPSFYQESNIFKILEDRGEKIKKILNIDPVLIPYSANKKYNLQELFNSLIENCPKHRSWIFSLIKGFSPFDFIPEELKDHILSKLPNNKRNSDFFSWIFKNPFVKQ